MQLGAGQHGQADFHCSQDAMCSACELGCSAALPLTDICALWTLCPAGVPAVAGPGEDWHGQSPGAGSATSTRVLKQQGCQACLLMVMRRLQSILMRSPEV